MLVPKKNRLAVYSYLFKEGVVVAAKSLTIDHQVIGVPNLQVVKMMISLKSRGYVRENFNWAHHYFYLTDAGIEYLRSYLHLPADIIPATLKKPAPVARPAGAREGGDAKEGSFKRRDDGYRREAGAFSRERAA
ncbi:hypothetical protein BASA81_009119 [Batrachochytrium salamandrivorans]|nr:hypothetical protein BASA81_009119 [Batrachochytrium salamandrivorans]